MRAVKRGALHQEYRGVELRSYPGVEETGFLCPLYYRTLESRVRDSSELSQTEEGKPWVRGTTPLRVRPFSSPDKPPLNSESRLSGSTRALTIL